VHSKHRHQQQQQQGQQHLVGTQTTAECPHHKLGNLEQRLELLMSTTQGLRTTQHMVSLNFDLVLCLLEIDHPKGLAL